MSGLPTALKEAQEASERCEQARGDFGQARENLKHAVRVAHAEGASTALIGRVIGVSRQTVARMLSADRPKG